jgi:hypothetical protein
VGKHSGCDGVVEEKAKEIETKNGSKPTNNERGEPVTKAMM